MTPSPQGGPPIRHRSLPESVHEILRAPIPNNEIVAFRDAPAASVAVASRDHCRKPSVTEEA